MKPLAPGEIIFDESEDIAVAFRRNIPASAPTNRKTRRALVKAIGIRQFKKIYKEIKA